MHAFGNDRKKEGERKTVTVTVLTAAMMGVEIAAGVMCGSMALLADGLHMASHATALCISAFAYVYARRHSHDRRFSFGTGKVNTLGGFTGAVLLGLFAVFMAWESLERMVSPVGIAFDQAIVVAVIGLAVNGISVFILSSGEEGGHHEHGHRHEHVHDHHHDDHHGRQGDHNLRSAYLHVLADALTSFLAIFALLAAKYFGLIWMDPLMGIVGAGLVTRWSLGLLRTTGNVLLDKDGPEHIQKKIKEDIESDGDSKVTDLHLWSVGPDMYSAIISVVAARLLEPEQYKSRISSDLGLVHVTVEVSKCRESDCGAMRK
jgi:cation diffusion facilitator family transporter